jgi:methylglyoxal synthase
VSSVTDGGAYTVRHSQPFDKLIAASDRVVVEFFAPVYATGTSVIGANGPVTVRVIAEFQGPRGGFQQVVTQVVNANTPVGQ